MVQTIVSPLITKLIQLLIINYYSLNTPLFIMLYWSILLVGIHPLLLQSTMFKKKLLNYLNPILRPIRLDFKHSLRFAPAI